MAEISIREALRQAIDEEMARDDKVFLLGEEVAEYNGPYKVSKGLLDKYGYPRVIDTPIAELGFTGMAVGAAMMGLRPVVEWMTFNFGVLAMDQIINNASKLRHMSGGQISIPMVVRGPNGPAEYLSSQHSQSFESYYAHVPGLKVVFPCTPYDCKGMLKTAIRDDNPVMFMESEMTYGMTGEVPEEEYTIPFGKADIKREGTDVSLITYGKITHMVLAAAEKLAEQGINAEVVDLRSLRPLDEDAIYASVRKTNRAVIIEEAWPIASVGSHVGWLISRNCFDDLDAQVELVASEDVPMPYNHAMELAVQPSIEKIVDAVGRVL
ncbi:pyruvate dehydrogenase complex E1 component subunit beta [Spirochaeta africana]|uniref:Pyruvate/2-oxoglutarate dehydrogenase complex, dehydrogenase component beta subunit n=1 Tax=Spirochaeta africana (strain ATCC 700263 / DSM 8902 / Z-7692) TaxID=889378 RepID=H9UK16_SPIAZ|nr:pyruvate dehydrogenase complex E1 component subunit beta [Spirochaeta africana]AFG37859.1 pyruvate/2-oxoglutarate dehydrogenase complex, dehydrogenase component beta subunit [Spirochaeta africana DSM 8902]